MCSIQNSLVLNVAEIKDVWAELLALHVDSPSMGGVTLYFVPETMAQRAQPLKIFLDRYLSAVFADKNEIREALTSQIVTDEGRTDVWEALHLLKDQLQVSSGNLDRAMRNVDQFAQVLADVVGENEATPREPEDALLYRHEAEPPLAQETRTTSGRKDVGKAVDATVEEAEAVVEEYTAPVAEGTVRARKLAGILLGVLVIVVIVVGAFVVRGT